MAISFDVKPNGAAIAPASGRFGACSTALLALEEEVTRALASGDESRLEILGYGEVTLVLRLRTARETLAVKRLPIFESRAAFDAYRAVSEEYVARLEIAKISVPATRLWASVREDGTMVAYVIQPELDGENLGSRWLARASGEEADWFFETVLRHTLDTITDTVGFDVQASNWIVEGRRLRYLDVTTPFLRDERRRERLDARPFFSSLPWLLRAPVRVMLGNSLFDKFYEPRAAIVDLLGNLHKERLGHLVARFLPIANARFESPIRAEEVASYYAGDAKMWAVLQTLRRADRWWQGVVRRRPYPFLLPGKIER